MCYSRTYTSWVAYVEESDPLVTTAEGDGHGLNLGLLPLAAFEVDLHPPAPAPFRPPCFDEPYTTHDPGAAPQKHCRQNVARVYGVYLDSSHLGG